MTESERRRERRAFIRAHHPDVGGDPALFVAGLARLDRRPTPRAERERVTVYRRRGVVTGLVYAVVEKRLRRTTPPRVR